METRKDRRIPVIDPRLLPPRAPVLFTLWAWLASYVWVDYSVTLGGFVVGFWIVYLLLRQGTKPVDVDKILEKKNENSL